VDEIHKIGIMYIYYRFQLGHRSLVTWIALGTKGCAGGQSPICISTRLVSSFRISSLSFICRV